ISDSDHWDNFHLVLEASISGGAKGTALGAVSFRAAPRSARLPDGYMAHVNIWKEFATGTLFRNHQQERNNKPLAIVEGRPHGNDTPFRLEIIADGPLMEVICNGKKVASVRDPDPIDHGHIILSVMENRPDDDPVMFTIRRITIRELTASPR